MNSIDSLRLDQWLWTTRFFKTRGMATQAIKGGKIKAVNTSGQGKTVKPAYEVKEGAILEIQKGAFQFVVTVNGLSNNRVSASIAQTLYTENADSIKKREEIAALMKAQPKNPHGGRKPDKYTLRKNRAIKRGFESD